MYQQCWSWSSSVFRYKKHIIFVEISKYFYSNYPPFNFTHFVYLYLTLHQVLIARDTNILVLPNTVNCFTTKAIGLCRGWSGFTRRKPWSFSHWLTSFLSKVMSRCKKDFFSNIGCSISQMVFYVPFACRFSILIDFSIAFKVGKFRLGTQVILSIFVVIVLGLHPAI